MPSDGELVPRGVCLEILKCVCANPVWPDSSSLLGKWQRDELSDLLGGSWEQLPKEQPRQTLRIRELPKGKSHRDFWAEPVITPFDSNHWVDRAALSSAVILPAAGFPVISVAIRVEWGVNNYPDALLSWELALIRMNQGRVALAIGPQQGTSLPPLSPGYSHKSGSLAIYSQAHMISFQISSVSSTLCK